MKYFAALFLLSNLAFAEPLTIASGEAGMAAFPNHQYVLHTVYQRIGQDVGFVVLPGKRSTSMSLHGQIDGESLRPGNYDSTVPNLVKVPTPFITADIRLFYRDGIELNELVDLQGLTIATVRGGRMTITIAEKYGAHLFEVKNSVQAFHALDDGRADVTLFMKVKGLELINRHNYDHINMSEFTAVGQVFYHWIQEEHAYLIPKLDQAFNELMLEGNFNVIN